MCYSSWLTQYVSRSVKDISKQLCFYCFFRLCSSYEECQHDTSRPVRLLDIVLPYENHCRSAKSTIQSNDYVAKIPSTIFPYVNRTRIYRNGTSYTGFTGIREVNDASISSESATLNDDGCGNMVIAVPSLFQRSESQLFVVTSLKASVIVMGLSDGTTLEKIDSKLLDIPDMNTVTKPANAIAQLAKSLRLCRGVEIGEDTGERWTSLIQNDSN